MALLYVGAWRRWLSAYEIALAVGLLVVPYVTRGYDMGMQSMARFAAVVFPTYLVCGRLLAHLPPPLATTVLVFSSFFLMAYAAMHAAGHQVF